MWMEFLPILQDLVPCWGRCPKNPLYFPFTVVVCQVARKFSDCASSGKKSKSGARGEIYAFFISSPHSLPNFVYVVEKPRFVTSYESWNNSAFIKRLQKGWEPWELSLALNPDPSRLSLKKTSKSKLNLLYDIKCTPQWPSTVFPSNSHVQQ